MSDDPYAGTGVRPFLNRGESATRDLPEPGQTEAPSDAPPKPPEADRKPKERKPSTAARSSSLEKRLTELYVSIGTMAVIADPVCGTAIISAAPDTAAALESLAKENPKIRKALEKMLTGGAWGAVLMAHFPIVTTILAHHGMLPPPVAESMGIEPKQRKAKPTLRAIPSDEDGPGVGSGTPAN